ncbi:hypothetical protein TWF718_009685 [Orbilia javanica]|uniref:Uncharacterized protein n=1 Tax=Orbilia javanica TaxID=47235 RepID=A0AAN8RBN1_9PEZI
MGIMDGSIKIVAIMPDIPILLPESPPSLRVGRRHDDNASALRLVQWRPNAMWRPGEMWTVLGENHRTGQRYPTVEPQTHLECVTAALRNSTASPDPEEPVVESSQTSAPEQPSRRPSRDASPLASYVPASPRVTRSSTRRQMGILTTKSSGLHQKKISRRQRGKPKTRH